jgi:hypothetical protein
MKTNNQHKTAILNLVVHSKTEGMPIFKCSCGVHILIVPDLSEMDKAIQSHLVEHRRITGQRLKEEAVVQMILKAITEYQF